MQARNVRMLFKEIQSSRATTKTISRHTNFFCGWKWWTTHCKERNRESSYTAIFRIPFDTFGLAPNVHLFSLLDLICDGTNVTFKRFFEMAKSIKMRNVEKRETMQSISQEKAMKEKHLRTRRRRRRRGRKKERKKKSNCSSQRKYENIRKVPLLCEKILIGFVFVTNKINLLPNGPRIRELLLRLLGLISKPLRLGRRMRWGRGSRLSLTRTHNSNNNS